MGVLPTEMLVLFGPKVNQIVNLNENSKGITY